MPSSSSVAIQDFTGKTEILTQILPRVEVLSEAIRPIPGPNPPRVRGYEILSLVGSGGMGIVYKARHRDLNRIVALKTIRCGALADPEFRERFRAEAEAVARLQHPNIIQVFEIGMAEPLDGEFFARPFISLEFVDGGSLAGRTGRPQPSLWVAKIVEKLASAIHSAHQQGVIHRDLKPANVLLTRDDEPKVADFGMAKQIESERDETGRFVTQTGIVMGTPEYMAPEQASGAKPTPAIDIYALGVILYELLTARVPFQGATPVDTMTIARQQEPVSPRRLQPGLSRDWETICLKCLEKDPAKRYATALALAEDLCRLQDGRTILARRVSEWEKGSRWCRRNPLPTLLLAGIVATFVISFALIAHSYWQAELAWHNETVQRQDAERKEKAERWERYRANLTAAASSLDVFDAGGALRNLRASPEEHRNWEWYHLYSRTDLAQSAHLIKDASISRRFISGDGSRVIMLGDGEFVRVMSTVTGQIAKLKFPTKGIKAAWFSRNSKFVAYPVGDDSIEVWDTKADSVRIIRHGHTSRPHWMELSADGSRLATKADDHMVRVWDTGTVRSVCTIAPQPGNLASAVLSPNGKRLVISRKAPCEYSLWDVETGVMVSTLPGLELGLQGIQFSWDDTRFATVASFPRNEVKLWSSESGKLMGIMNGHENTVVYCIFSPDDTRLASCSLDQTVRLWDAITCRPIAALTGHKGCVYHAAFSHDGNRLVSASQDHTLRLWDARSGAPLNVLPGHTAELASVAYTPDGKMIVSLGRDAEVRLWDTRLIEWDGFLRGHTKFIYGVAYHPDGKRMISGGWDGTARVWDEATGRQLLLLHHGENAIVTAIAVHPDGTLLASRSVEAVHLWDLNSGREIHRWKTASDGWRHTRLAFSPKGDVLASGGEEDRIHLWDVNSRRELATLRGQGDVVRDVAFSPDGHWLASACESGDRSIRIWSIAEKKQVQRLEGHTECVYALSFNANGKLLASGAKDGTARLWNTETWTEIARLKHGSNIYGVAFTPDGTRLACACANNAIRIWDLATHQEIVDLRGHNAYVHSVAFSPDGKRLLSGSGDFTLRIWDTTRPQDQATGWEGARQNISVHNLEK